MKKILPYIANFFIFCGIAIVMNKFFVFRENVNTWRDIYRMLPIIIPTCILLSIFAPVFKPKDKKNKTLKNDKKEQEIK